MQVDVSQLKMPAISRHGQAVLDAVSGDDVNLMMVADQVAQDPALSSSLLYIANSPLFRRQREVTNSRQAVNLLGARRVRMAVLVTAMRDVNPKAADQLDALWEHSFGIAGLCRMLAEEAFPLAADDMEMTGLLHDLGALILAANFPKEYAHITLRSLRRGLVMEEEERRVFGNVDRGMVVDVTGSTMYLPAVTQGALRLFFGDAPLDSVDTDEQRHAAVLALAHHIDVLAMGRTARPVERIPGDFEQLKALLGLRDEDVDEIMDNYANLVNDAITL